jgi:Uma2 family endonuclease
MISTRAFTIADVAALPTELPSKTVDYELDNGKIIVMPPPGDVHGSIQLRIGAALLNQGEEKGHGEARTEVGVILWRDPDRLVGADAAFIAKSSLPIRVSSEGYLETIPDIVVEVRSKNDTESESLKKIADYQKAGVRVVWFVDPESQTVTVHSANAASTIYQTGDILLAEGVIPGFSLPVEAIFRRK